MKTYEVTAKDGVIFDGEVIPKGDTIQGDPSSAQVRAFLHFKQVKEVKDKGSESAEKEGPSTVAEYKEALEKLGVTIPDGAKKKELVGLYEEATNAEQ